jgi:hypothetical protein
MAERDHVMAALDERLDDIEADEAGPASDEHAHVADARASMRRSSRATRCAKGHRRPK